MTLNEFINELKHKSTKIEIHIAMPYAHHTEFYGIVDKYVGSVGTYLTSVFKNTYGECELKRMIYRDIMIIEVWSKKNDQSGKKRIL